MLRFEADDGFKGAVLDLSAVGMRVHVPPEKAVQPSEQMLAGTLTFENGAHVRIKVRVVRATVVGEEVELGLEVAEADKSFYDALPKLRHDSGETPQVK